MCQIVTKENIKVGSWTVWQCNAGEDGIFKDKRFKKEKELLTVVKNGDEAFDFTNEPIKLIFLWTDKSAIVVLQLLVVKWHSSFLHYLEII